jgi:IS30 family transposase
VRRQFGLEVRVHPGPRLIAGAGEQLVALPEGANAERVCEALSQSITTLPTQLRRSLTWDQGSEMSEHRRFSVETGVDVYFCDPQSPW